MAETRGFNTKAGLKLVPQAAPTFNIPTDPPVRPERPAPPSPQPPRRPPPPPASPTPQIRNAPQPVPQMQHQYHTPPSAGPGLFSSLKGGAGSLFKNIKDTSSKVMQTVQQSMGRAELDLSYVTSRLIVTSFPAEGIEAAYRHHIDDVRTALETRHGYNYSVYNVSGRSYAPTKFNARVTDCGWPQRQAPPLRTL